MSVIANDNPDRIQSLDLLRGVAVLGILLMNITAFSQGGSAYINPLLGAGLEGYNKYFWNFNWLFADMKFMSLFSILFGAGIVLFSDNITSKGLKAWKWKYKRLFFLFIFGMIHAYLIWSGDILVAYSICGAIVFPFRKLKIQTLWIIAALLFIVPAILSLSLYYMVPLDQLKETFNFWDTPEAVVNAEVNAYRTSYLKQMPYRAQGAFELQTVIFGFETFWRVSALMIIGVILYRTKVLTTQKSRSYYIKLALYGLIFGLLISGIGLYNEYQHNWEGTYSMVFGRLSNYVSSLPMALGYIGLILLLAKSKKFHMVKYRLQMTGRMAFTNYIGMSVICSFIFYGYGLNLIERVDRLEQFLIVLCIWSIMLIISPIVLSKYKYGPLEWVWRKLTYSKML